MTGEGGGDAEREEGGAVAAHAASTRRPIGVARRIERIVAHDVARRALALAASAREGVRLRATSGRVVRKGRVETTPMKLSLVHLAAIVLPFAAGCGAS